MWIDNTPFKFNPGDDEAVHFMNFLHEMPIDYEKFKKNYIHGNRTLLMTSYGIESEMGCAIISKELDKLDLGDISKTKMLCIEPPGYELDGIIKANAIKMGFNEENLYMSSIDGIPSCYPDIIYLGVGNPFEILDYIKTKGFYDYMMERFNHGLFPTFLGASAGAMLFGSDLFLASKFESHSNGMMDYSALGFLEDSAIIPHITSKQLKRFLKTTEEHVLNRYAKIYSIADDEALVLKV